jgi:hypothetical protein
VRGAAQALDRLVEPAPEVALSGHQVEDACARRAGIEAELRVDEGAALWASVSSQRV